MIKDHRQLSDHDFIGQLENNSLAPGLFSLSGFDTRTGQLSDSERL
jgi:hypothetical protein